MVLLQAIGNDSGTLFDVSVTILICALVGLQIIFRRKILAFFLFLTSDITIPISVNYHFTRKCNRTCGFCLHTEKVSVMTLSKVFILLEYKTTAGE